MRESGTVIQESDVGEWFKRVIQESNAGEYCGRMLQRSDAGEEFTEQLSGTISSSGGRGLVTLISHSQSGYSLSSWTS